MENTSHVTVSIVQFASRIICNGNSHTRKFYSCHKHFTTLHLCKLCFTKSKQIKYAYTCELCAQSFCLPHFLKHSSINQSLIGIINRGCIENSINDTADIIKHLTPKKFLRYSQNLKTDVFCVYLSLTPEEYKFVVDYLLALTRPGNIKSLILTVNINEPYYHNYNNFLASSGEKLKDLNVQNLSLKYNCIDSQGMEGLAKGLRLNKSITTIDLSQNIFSAEGALFLAKALNENRSIKSLNLDYSRFLGDDGAVNFFGTLGNQTVLTYLNVSSSSIQDNGASKIAEFIEKNSSLLELNLHNNYLMKKGNEIGSALSKNKSLQILDLGYCLYGIGADEIAKSLAINNSLLTFDLTHNEFTALHCSKLFEMLAINKSLKKLILSANPIGEEGASKLSDTLKKNSSLLCLDLTDCQIGSNGSIKIADSLLENNTLQDLILAQNDIDDTAASELGKVLQKNICLQKLDLYSNKIGVQGGINLAKALLTNTHLLCLVLNNNKILKEGGLEFAKSLLVNRTLKTLNFGTTCDYNEIGPAFKELFEAQKVNKGVEIVCTQTTMEQYYEIVEMTRQPKKRLTYCELIRICVQQDGNDAFGQY